MKRIKTIALVILCVLTVGTLSGCTSDEDVRTYLQALLDASYKNDSTVFVDMGLGSEKEAQALYDKGVDTGTDAFCSQLSIPEELQGDFRRIYMDMLGKVHYTVGEAEKQSDGSYIVTVSYEKMIVFQPTLEAHAAKTAQMYQEWVDDPGLTPTDEDEMMRQIIIALKESMEEALAEPEYAGEQTTTVRIELEDGVYTPNTEDVQKLEMALFDTDYEE